MDIFGPWICGFAFFYLPHLVVLANRFAAFLICRFSFAQTIVIETAACFQSRTKQSGLGTTGVEAIEKGFARHG